jgi:hypothetical protein
MRRLLIAAVLLAALASTSPAGAHGDEGEIEVVNTVPQGDGDAVTYTVELTYANDADPVDGATVTATLRGPGGAQPPVDLPGVGDGWYAGTVHFPGPGQWRVTFATGDPEATAQVTYRVPEPPPPSTTTVPPATTTTTPPAASDVEDAQLVADEGGDDGPPAGMVIGLVVAGLLLVGTAVVVVLRRRPA